MLPKKFDVQACYTRSDKILNEDIEDIVKSCVMVTLRQRLWGAWQVLRGKAGILIVEINRKEFYR